tara:strand:- start:266 stop:499 length:234 start_codon:yes stop_codon:yes gene_type:complete
MRVTFGAYVVFSTACILLNTIWVCLSVGADSFETFKLASHFANMHERECHSINLLFGLSLVLTSDTLKSATYKDQSL